MTLKHFLSLTALALCSLHLPAQAWSNHALSSYRALEVLPEVRDAAPVRAEPLEAFLAAQGPAIARLLQAQEAWAREHIAHYPPLPPALRLDADHLPSAPKALRQAFLKALRVSPDSRLALYVQPDPHGTPPPGEAMPHEQVSALPHRDKDGEAHRFVRVQPGQLLAALAVLASASDEPDYGMDVNLWEDSPGPWGQQFGLGKLPFGNPKLDFSTQAPFHMGFYDESPILYAAAGFLRRTYPLLRLHQYQGLSELAFQSGHPYWGWRFAGLAMHYVQDMTQPYHARLAPGFGTARMIGIQLRALLGMPQARDDMVVLLSNRHFVLERYASQLNPVDASAPRGNALERALADTGTDTAQGAWTATALRDTVARQSYGLGEAVTAQLLASVPSAYVDDPGFDFGAEGGDIDVMAEVERQKPQTQAALDASIARLMRHFGAHSRNLVRAILAAR